MKNKETEDGENEVEDKESMQEETEEDSEIDVSV